ncbi:MAG: formyltetrahydrofolate deformylase [Actinomycetota bacterium]
MSAVFLLSCPDQQGVVSATAAFIAEHDGNIIHAEQHVDGTGGTGTASFFQRIEFDLDGFALRRDEILPAFSPVAERFDMHAELRFTDEVIPTAVLASRQPHCLYDILTRWRTGELPIDVRVVVSNHPDHREFCEHLGVPYVHLPVTPDTKPQQEADVLATLAEHGAELVVLARYMQILSDGFVGHHPDRIINIHHSFLPAFIGANPYRQAHDRGVKLIGATAHYATADLDEGPIIAQDTEHVSHRDDVARLTQKGRDLETIVLARAVRAHAEHRVLVHGRKTIVFS